MSFLRLVVLVTVVSIGSQLSAHPSDHLRNPDQLVLEGLESFGHDDVRGVLQANFDLIVASRPNTPLAAYLKTLQDVIATGLAHSGCESAQVQAGYDQQRDKIVVRVQEG